MREETLPQISEDSIGGTFFSPLEKLTYGHTTCIPHTAKSRKVEKAERSNAAPMREEALPQISGDSIGGTFFSPPEKLTYNLHIIKSCNTG